MTSTTALENTRAGEQRTLATMLASQKNRMNELAGAVVGDRLLQLALLATRKTKALQACSVESVVKAVLDAARLGLDIDGVQGALIPFRGEATFMPMVRGFVALAYREKTVESIESRLVFEDELFDVDYGDNPRITHKPKFGTGPDRKCVACYAVAHLRGRAIFEVMDAASVLAIRDRSPNVQWAKEKGKQTPWDTDPGEMFRKTVVKRLCKALPTGDRLRAAVEHDNNVESGVLDGEVVAVTAPPPKLPAPKPALDLDDVDVQKTMGAVSSELSRVGIAHDAAAREKEIASILGHPARTVADFEEVLAVLQKRPTTTAQ